MVASADKGHILPFAVANVELPEVFRGGAVLGFRLDVHLPLTAEAVEIVDEIARP